MIEIGQRVGAFEIVERLGAGGMGEVFRARDTTLGREVAIKVVAQQAGHADRLDRLRREARVLASLNHPGIAAIYGLEQLDGVPLLILELIDGPTMAERLKTAPLALADALEAARSTADALAFAHRKGIVHRDLKPANIKYGADGRVKLLDFGLAKFMADSDQASADEATAQLTADGAVFGTAPYMSPEQARGGTVDRKTDIWAFGCVLFEMLTGKRAFPSIAAVFESEPEWSALPAATPPAVRSLIKRCVQKDAARRPSDLADAVSVLTSTLHDARLGTRPSSPTGLRWAGAALLAAVVMGSVLLWRSGDQAGPAAGMAVERAATAIPLRRSIAALDLSNLSRRPDRAWISTALRELIGAELWSGNELRVISGEGVSQMRIDLELPASEAFTIDTLTRIRENLGADLVVAGSFVATGDRLQVSVRVQDSRTGDTVAQVSETGAVADVIALGQAVGGQLRQSLGLSAVGHDSGSAASLPPGRAGQLYAEGLERARTYDLLGARRLFEQALGEAADLPLVRMAYAQSLSALGYEAAARQEAQRAVAGAAGLPPLQRQRLDGQFRILTNDWPGAIDVYGAALKAQPDDLEAGLTLARAQWRAGRIVEGVATVEALRRHGPPFHDDPQLDLLESNLRQAMGEHNVSVELAQRAAVRARARGARFLLASAQATESRTLILLGDYQGAIEAGREAQRQYEAAGNRSGVADALGTVAIAMFYLADYDGERRLHEQELSVARDIGARRQESRALGNLAMVDSLTGRLASALARERETEAIRRELGDERNLPSSLHNIAELYQSMADLDRAEQSYREGAALAVTTSATTTGYFLLTGLGDVAAARGNLAEARKFYEEATAGRTAAGEKAYAAASQLALATALVAAGQGAEAATLARTAAEVFRSVKDPAREGWALGFLAAAELQQGRHDQAQAAIDLGRPLIERATYLRAILTFAMNEARVLMAAGDTAAAQKAAVLLRGALDQAIKGGYVNRQLELRLVLGEAELLDPATRTAGLARLRALAADARSRKYAVIADRATALLF